MEDLTYRDALADIRDEQRESILQKLRAAGFAVDGKVDLAFKGATAKLLRRAELSIGEVSAVLGAQNKLSADAGLTHAQGGEVKQLAKAVAELKDVQVQLKDVQVQEQLKAELAARKFKYSVTNASAVGGNILDRVSGRSQKLTEDILGRLLSSKLPSVVDSPFRHKWAHATNEEQLQVLAVSALESMVSKHKVLDTHKEHYYKMPTAKIDIALSASKRACWATLVAPLELKFMLSDNATGYKDALGQLWDRWEKVQETQDGRDFMTGCILSKSEIELWTFGRQGLMTHTGLLPFEWEEGCTGYQALASFLHTSAPKLGYKALPAPHDFTASTGVEVRRLALLAGRPNTRPVYTARYGSKKKARKVVVKLGSKSEVEREVGILESADLKGKRGFPEVLASGELPDEVTSVVGATHYFIISSLGEHLGDEHSDEQILMVMHDVATALGCLTKKGLLHRDVSPSNIVLAQKGGVEQGLLLDYHVACQADDDVQTSCVTGKHLYLALRLQRPSEAPDTEPDPAHVHSEATDVESLFYTLLDIASNSQAITWRHVPPDMVHRTKFNAMFYVPEWRKALRRCRRTLRPVIRRLHKLIFADSHVKQYLATHVTAKEFLAVAAASRKRKRE